MHDKEQNKNNTKVRDDTVLTDESAQNLSKTFKALLHQQREKTSVFKPALDSFNSIIAKFQDIGLERIGMEFASLDRLRELNIAKKTPRNDDGEMPEKEVLYCILEIYDARFLLRLHPQNVIDCHLDNLNKPSNEVQYLDNDFFWYKKVNGTRAEHFFRCDLTREEERIDLMNTILRTAAACAMVQEISEMCLPQKSSTGLSKPVPPSRRL